MGVETEVLLNLYCAMYFNPPLCHNGSFSEHLRQMDSRSSPRVTRSEPTTQPSGRAAHRYDPKESADFKVIRGMVHGDIVDTCISVELLESRTIRLVIL